MISFSDEPWELKTFLPVVPPACRVSVLSVDFLTMWYDGHILFTLEERNSEEWMYSLPGAWCINVDRRQIVTPERIARAILDDAFGRCLRLTASQAFQGIDLFFSFHLDGTGRFWASDFQYDKTEILFRWEPSALGLSDPMQILHMPIRGHESQWRALCEDRLKAEIVPQMPDPYTESKDLPNDPLDFHCGLEAELERVTHWICYTDPTLWTAPGGVSVCYGMRGPDECGGLLWYQTETGGYGIDSEDASPRLKTLFQLTFEHNTFSGWSWEHYGSYRSRRSNWRLKPRTLEFEVMPPSAHERVEALVELADWLVGKVPETERHALLGLTSDALA